LLVDLSEMEAAWFWAVGVGTDIYVGTAVWAVAGPTGEASVVEETSIVDGALMMSRHRAG
jgi:hypothetical protein